MKLKNLTIGTQLFLGLGLILAFVIILGGVAWLQSDQLWQQTQGMYDHPLTVRRAIGELEADILSMWREMKDLVLTENDQERELLLQGIDTSEADAYRQFDIVYTSYLGPRSDVDQAHQAFVQWKTIREETSRLLREGKRAEALQRTKRDGVGGAQVEKILAHIQIISDFAKNRGDQFYLDATQLKNSLNLQLVMMVTAILLLSGGVGYLLWKGIKDPLQALTAVTGAYRQGEFDARSRYVSANEFGDLSSAFNQLGAMVQVNILLKENVAQLAGVMLREEELGGFCRALLQALLEHTGSQVGAVYLLNEGQTAFEHFASLGLSANQRASFSATIYEGEFGAALATRQIQHITQIPVDTRLTFSTVSGDFMPREIITIPILGALHPEGGSNDCIAAVISLASIRSYSELALRLVNDIWSVLTARLNGVLTYRQLREFSEKLEHQNRELDAQKQELGAQTNELSHQNTELEMQTRQLDEANRLKSAFLSNMSHELRTPLNSVIALSGVLNRRLARAIPAEEYSYLEIIERNGKHLLALINDILDLSRIEAGRDELSLSHFSVRGLVSEIVSMLEAQAGEKQIALMNEVREDLPLLTSDLSKCRHILQNLVANAVKFTESGTVKISAQVAGETLSISVSDTGIGIAADQLPFIFDEFRQADESTSRKYGGTGLGLAIARKYTAFLQGSLSVESAPGRGSTFTLHLPLTLTLPQPGQDPEEYRGDHKTALPSASAGLGHNILLVEDSEPIVIQMTDILTTQGYQVRIARNGKQALEQLEQTLPEAVILDLMMPEVDGFQVLKAIRGTEKTAQLPVLILTARHVTREELSFLKGNHIHQLIQKGDVSRAELLAAVAQMVTLRQERAAKRATGKTPRLAAHSLPKGKPVILVVEDNPDNLRTARALLEETCIVFEATDGKAGLEQARRHMPDLVLTDLALPEMDGYALLAALREDEALRQIPVVAVTASAMKGNREEILARGFDGYISKPIDEQLLQKTLREVFYGE